LIIFAVISIFTLVFKLNIIFRDSPDLSGHLIVMQKAFGM